MWKYISGFRKSLKRKRKKKTRKLLVIQRAQRSTRRTGRKFSAKWQVGRPWLQHDQHKGMICKWCIENKATFMAQSVFNSARFIDGCTSYKAESIAYHEKSAAHLLAQQCHKAKQHPEKTPANLVRQQMLKQYTGKLRLLFRNAHAVSKNFWASENLSGRVHFEGYSPEWRVLSQLSVRPCAGRPKKDGRRGERIAALLKNRSQSAFRANVISTTPERDR